MLQKLDSIPRFTAFNSIHFFLIQNFGLGENVTIYGIDNSSSTHTDSTKKKFSVNDQRKDKTILQ